MKIFDMLGRPLRTVYNGILEPGLHEIPFTAPPSMPTGMYTVILTTGREWLTVSMTLMR